jgi:hypothetical protein
MIAPSLLALISSAGTSLQGRILRWFFPASALWVLVGVWVTYFRRRPRGALSLAIVLLISAVAALFAVTGLLNLFR